LSVGWAALLALGALHVHLQPGAARPGDAVLVLVRDATAPPTGTLGDQELRFLPFGDDYAALVGLAVEVKPGPLALSVSVGPENHRQRIIGNLSVLAGEFPRRELRVSKRFTSPSKKEKAWALADQRAFSAALLATSESWPFEFNFAPPRPLVVTAPFGDRRTINGRTKSIHYGTDLDGRVGDPVFAANDGTAVLVRECFSSGNTVLLHHGGKLFTAYFHLSSFDVKAGSVVKRGDLLGALGSTGRVTGPHLHFGVKLEERWVNPLSLLKLDFR
jgi:murein DD-endopeptidase MepM/ murein hydrolase activator NlpD